MQHPEYRRVESVSQFAQCESIEGLGVICDALSREFKKEDISPSTRKPLIEKMLSIYQIFPHQIHRRVIPADGDVAGNIRKNLKDIVAQGDIPGIRTASRVKGENIMANVGSTFTEYGHIQHRGDVHDASTVLCDKIQGDPTITHVILMENPRFLMGDKSNEAGIPIAFRLELKNDDFIHHTGEINIEGVSGTLDMRTVDWVFDHLEARNPGILHGSGYVQKTGSCVQSQIDWNRSDLLSRREKIENQYSGLLLSEQQVIEARKFIERLIQTWSTDENVALLKRLEILKSIGLGIVEIQARFFPKTRQWKYGFYDLRGTQDDTFRNGIRFEDLSISKDEVVE